MSCSAVPDYEGARISEIGKTIRASVVDKRKKRPEKKSNHREEGSGGGKENGVPAAGKVDLKA
jgi:hypothetical protein